MLQEKSEEKLKWNKNAPGEFVREAKNEIKMFQEKSQEKCNSDQNASGEVPKEVGINKIGSG